MSIKNYRGRYSSSVHVNQNERMEERELVGQVLDQFHEQKGERKITLKIDTRAPRYGEWPDVVLPEIMGFAHAGGYGVVNIGYSDRTVTLRKLEE